jgi:FkbM family methyltransferase
MRLAAKTMDEGKRLWHRMTGRAIGFGVQAKGHKELLGGWWLRPDLLGPDALVYSCGVGRDISFDLAMIDRHGCRVFAFDPTPASIDWLNGRAPPRGFHFSPWGIAGFDGEGRLFPPEDPGSVHHSILAPSVSSAGIAVPFHRITTIMAQNGHERVDVLKLDIEGAEYPVLADLMSSPIRPGQILVEFHHRFEGIGLEKTVQTVELLLARGYRIFHIYNWRGQEFSFIYEGKG